MNIQRKNGVLVSAHRKNQAELSPFFIETWSIYHKIHPFNQVFSFNKDVQLSPQSDSRAHYSPEGNLRLVTVTSHYLWLPFPLPRASGHESRSFRLYPGPGIAGMGHHISLDPFDGWVIFHCVGFVYLLICWVGWGCFQFVAVVDNGVVCICEKVVWGLWTGLLTPTGIPCVTFELLPLSFHIKVLMARLVF